MLLPPGTAVEKAAPEGSATRVDGVVAMDPVAVRHFYETSPGLRVIHAEDERVEAELQVSDGKTTTNVRARLVCAGGSRLIVLSGPAT